MNILKYKTLPASLTSYDFLKALALVLMVVDHIGYFFFPHEIWFRVIGRFSAPIWFFLIGHARTREISKLFWILGALVWFFSLVAGDYLFPATIIFTLIAARLSIDWIAVRALRNWETLAGMSLLLFFIGLPTLIFVEYGTQLFLFSLLGYMVAHRKERGIRYLSLIIFSVVPVVSYLFMESLFMSSLDKTQFLTFCGGMVLLAGILVMFRPAQLSWAVPVFLRWPVQLLGRRTLEIYAAHLIMFRLLAMVVNPERFGLFDFKVFAFEAVIRMFL
ncbi:MAG: hypothetical protein IT559_02900 [Alphaproteobacteria bacterium]|nr:hypothetical protein [Alphaproteobacteria bacterium]